MYACALRPLCHHRRLGCSVALCTRGRFAETPPTQLVLYEVVQVPAQLHVVEQRHGGGARPRVVRPAAEAAMRAAQPAAAVARHLGPVAAGWGRVSMLGQG